MVHRIREGLLDVAPSADEIVLDIFARENMCVCACVRVRVCARACVRSCVPVSAHVRMCERACGRAHVRTCV